MSEQLGKIELFIVKQLNSHSKLFTHILCNTQFMFCMTLSMIDS
jgi:hypothetical protein